MSEVDIRKYAELMRELGLTGLEITEGDRTVRMERTAPMVPKEMMTVDLSPVSEGTAASTRDDTGSVKSPIVGVFYAAPAENADMHTLRRGGAVQAHMFLLKNGSRARRPRSWKAAHAQFRAPAP